MTQDPSERRRLARAPRESAGNIELSYMLPTGRTVVMKVWLVDLHVEGCGLESVFPLEPDTRVWLVGTFTDAEGTPPLEIEGYVAWSRPHKTSMYRMGIRFVIPSNVELTEKVAAVAAGAEGPVPVPVSASASGPVSTSVSVPVSALVPEIEPAPPEAPVSDVEKLVARITEASNDPVTDMTAIESVFDVYAHLSEAEKRKRWAILALLYLRRLKRPRKASLAASEVQALLGVTKEQAEFSLWYLEEVGAIASDDCGGYAITLAGVRMAEAGETGEGVPLAALAKA